MIKQIKLKTAVFALLLGATSFQPAQASLSNSFNELSVENKIVIGYLGTIVIGAGAALLAKTLANLRKSSVGIVSIDGTISASSLTVHQLRTFFEDKTIAAIVLKINSGGGAPGASQCIFNTINELRAKHNKPVIAWVENIAASGAYYIASAADTIIAAPSAMIGSIGVRMGAFFELKDFLADYKIKSHILTAGTYKAAGDMFETMTPEQKASLQEMLDSTYKRFVSDVQSARSGLAEKESSLWANGKVFDADTALSLGLIDAVGSQLSVEETIKALLATKNKVNKKEINWVYPAKTITTIFGGTFEMPDKRSYIEIAIDKVCDRVEAKIEEKQALRTELSA